MRSSPVVGQDELNCAAYRTARIASSITWTERISVAYTAPRRAFPPRSLNTCCSRHAPNNPANPVETRSENASQRLQDVVRRNRRGERIGVCSVCSAHPSVIEAAIEQAIEDKSVLLVESTSSQVNQFAGYTGQTPDHFAEFVHSAAMRAGLSEESVLLGGDHLGPYPWRNEQSSVALEKACELVRQCVLAGYGKIHLDASMACADDGKTGPDEHTVAHRAAILCRAAESAHAELPATASRLLYVIGTEVPVPGGELVAGQPPSTTPAENVSRTLEVFRAAFEEQGVSSAWGRVIGMVVQPGVEFGE